MDDHELIQELERFTTRFTDRVAQATEVLERAPHRQVRDQALRKTLGYISSAIEIATEPHAEIGLLDMVVFVRLCRRVLDERWIPSLYGEQGRELSDAFGTSETEIDDIATRALGASRSEHVASLVDAWLADNPTQVRVEGIRLADFASGAARATSDRMLEARGILSSVATATQAANEAMMLVERGLFLLHRMPTVFRLQARLASREIVGDSIRPVVTLGAVAAGILAIGAVFIRRLGRARARRR